MAKTAQEGRTTARRAQILEAAARVFAEKGFHSTTVRDVARAAGVADGTIYNYFENKGELLLGLVDPMTQAPPSAPDPAALAGLSLRGFVRLHLLGPLRLFEANNFELFRVIVSEVVVNAELRARFGERVLTPTTRLAEAGLARWAAANGVTLPEPRLRVRALSGLVFGLILQRLMGDEVLEARWEELPDLLTDLLVDGLGGGAT